MSARYTEKQLLDKINNLIRERAFTNREKIEIIITLLLEEEPNTIIKIKNEYDYGV